jgi:hypothetical protein
LKVAELAVDIACVEDREFKDIIGVI